MLYQNIFYVAVGALSLLQLKVYGETQILTGAYTCTAGSTDTCIMRCNEEKEVKDATISCGNAGECYYYCDEKKCNEDGVIDASNANNFYLIQTSNADECLKDATIYLPNNGNAYFTTSSGTNKPFKDATIQEGANTGNITIELHSGTNSADAMKNTKIYASNAETLVIDIGSNQEIETAYIDCPDYPPSNPYTGLLIAPCIIDGSNGAIFSGANLIVAPSGYPLGVWIPSGFTDGSETRIDCDGRVDDLNGNQGYWDYIDDLSLNSNCYWTGNPTSFPTSAPVIVTTISPTITPSESPITSKPLTTIPTTSNPTTLAPTTSNPTTSIPTKANPTTASPSTGNPTTQSPSSPTTTIQPTFNPMTYTTGAPTLSPDESSSSAGREGSAISNMWLFAFIIAMGFVMGFVMGLLCCLCVKIGIRKYRQLSSTRASQQNVSGMDNAQHIEPVQPNKTEMKQNIEDCEVDADVGKVSCPDHNAGGPGAGGNNVGMMRGKVMDVHERKDQMMEERTYTLNANNMSKNVKRNAKKMRMQHGEKQMMMRRSMMNNGGNDDDMDDELAGMLSSDGDNESMYVTPKRDGYWTKGTETIRD